jgi:putative nucleotidyltransferase with HDIG domain
VTVVTTSEDITAPLPWRAIKEPEWRAVLASTAALARSDNEDVLLKEVCEAAVLAGGYLLAWYGRVLTNGHFELTSVSSAGPEQGYLEDFNLDWSHDVTTHSPGGMAVDCGEPVFTPDILTDERFAPWRDRANEYGIRSMVSIPVTVEGVLDGVLNIYAADAGAFDTTATDILSTLAQHLGVSMERLRANSRVNDALEGTIRVLTKALEARDAYTAGHQAGVAALAEHIAIRLGLRDRDVQGVRVAALVHDVGKIGVPTELLLKPGALREAEMQLIRDHAAIGQDVLSDVDFPWPIAEIVGQHHERLDGSGYPRALQADQILLAAKIIAVADVAEAMGRRRPYREAVGRAGTIEYLVSERDRLFDPDCVDACVAILQDGTFTM